jgi:serine/threonine protein kinase
MLSTEFRWRDVVPDEKHELGRGAFGRVVYGCTKEKKTRSGIIPARDVAVKFWMRPLATMDDQRAFMREIEVANTVHHPACVSLLSYSIVPVATVCEFLKYTLRNVIQSESRGVPPTSTLPDHTEVKWDDTTRAIVAIGVAFGMEYLHSKNIIHRDLKTDNILLDDRFRPKVGDFGLSKIMSTDTEQVSHAMQMTSNLGTPLFMAPELFMDVDDPYTTAVDVYAYGMLLYELCTLARPFKEKGEMQKFQLQLFVAGGQRPTIPPEVPDSYRALMTECWNHNPSARPTFAQIVQKMVAIGRDGEYQYLFEGTDINVYEEYLDYVRAPPNHR